MKMCIKNNKKGFTLVETLVAIFILTTAIAAAMTAAGSGLQSSIYARDQITAYYLGEEAVEYIRNIRDNNFATHETDWLANIPSGCLTTVADANTGCRIDALNNKIVGNATDFTLRFKKDVGYFYDDSHTDLLALPSKFTRRISIQQIPGTDGLVNEVLITVTLSWGNGSFGVRSFTLREQLFNWISQDTL